MHIDLPTLSLVIIVVNLVQIAVLLLQFYSNRTIKGIGWWLAWSIFIAVGFTFLYLRSFPGVYLYSILFQNASIMIGLIFLYVGITRFLGYTENKIAVYSLYGLYVFAIFFFTFVNDDIIVRTIIISVSVSVIAFATAFALFKYRTKHLYTSATFFAVIQIIHGSYYVFRAITAILHFSSFDPFSINFSNVFLYIDAISSSMLFTFCLIIMVNQKLNEEIHNAKVHFESVFNTSPDAALITRMTDAVIVNVNDAFCSVTGYTREYAIGKSSLELDVWKNAEDRERMMEEIRKKGSLTNKEYTFVQRNGEVLTGLLSATMIDLNGSYYLLGVVHDITHRKKAENELKAKNEELERVNSEKDTLFSIISHDLKNAFNVVLGYTGLIAEDIDELSKDELYSIALKMNKASHNLYNLLENLLDWSLIQKGKTTVNQESVPLFRLTEEITGQIQHTADHKKINIEKSVAHDLLVLTDRSMLSVVLRNLLSNALKFTNPGGTVSLTAEKHNGGNILISVRDTGIGMSKEISDNIFNLNKKSFRAGTYNETGTGLGMTLVKEYVSKLGGTISVESEEGKGSLFTVILPSA